MSEVPYNWHSFILKTPCLNQNPVADMDRLENYGLKLLNNASHTYDEFSNKNDRIIIETYVIFKNI